jgi:hypothetical protein
MYIDSYMLFWILHVYRLNTVVSNHVISDHVTSEWLLLNANSEKVQLYDGENKLIFNDMTMRSALY